MTYQEWQELFVISFINSLTSTGNWTEPEAKLTADEELRSWKEEDSVWKLYTPEEAVYDSMSYWEE